MHDTTRVMTESKLATQLGKIAVLVSHLEPKRKKAFMLPEEIKDYDVITTLFLQAIIQYLGSEYVNTFSISFHQNEMTVTRL